MIRAEMFNKKAAKKNSKADEIINIIDIKNGQTIADIGAGGGYFALKFAEIVGRRGKVYAVEINADFLKFIKKSSEKEGFSNIITMDKLDIPEHSLDFVFMRNVTHHMPDRVFYFKNLKKFFKASGKFIIIDYKKDTSSFLHRPIGHALKKKLSCKKWKQPAI